MQIFLPKRYFACDPYNKKFEMLCDPKIKYIVSDDNFPRLVSTSSQGSEFCGICLKFECIRI